MKIIRALISVSDKAGIADFARALEKQGVDIISTGGTAELLRKKGVPVREISSFTGYPEVLEGRVKTLHPRVHGGLLYKRDNPKHEKEAREQGFEPIDLVVVNLYPFEQTIAKPDVTLAEAIENIDIGGPSMIRSAAKNYESVTVVVDPADYNLVLETMHDNDGETTLELRERLAIKAFVKTSSYDRAISTFLNQEQTTDASFSLTMPLVAHLRYGENPHQKAALYGDFDRHFEKLHGKDVRSVCGGLLVQDSDTGTEEKEGVVSKRQPTQSELEAMRFGWRVVKHVKSNAIVYSAPDRTLAIGAGQMSRVDSSRIAIWKAQEAGLSLKGSAIASDAFFPFADGLIAAADAGATCAIQPGGSMRDEEVIAAADEREMAMIFTGVRHFRH